MRVEPAPYVFRTEDRRQRFAERRGQAADRRSEPRDAPRARHAAYGWFAPAFGAHLLGQIASRAVPPLTIQRAYLQPEARTPLRPTIVKSA
jgi:hypothetical protein